MAFGRDTSEIRASVTADTRGLQREFKAATLASDRLAVGVDKANVKLKQAEVAAGKAAAAHKRAADAFGRDSKQSYEAALRASKANIRVKESTLDVADAHDRLTASSGRVHAAGGRVDGVWGKVGLTLGKVTKGAVLAGAALAGAAVAGAAQFVASGVQAAASFDKTLRQFASIADVPKQQLKDMSALALKMGKDTSFGAQDAAQAMLDLAKGGLTAAQIKGGALQATLTLAAAGGIELADAGTYMANTMGMFGLKAKNATDVAAALAGGANASTASVESLGVALSQVGSGARNAGLSMQDTIGTLAAFDNVALKGSDAGTSLKTFLTRIVPTTKTAEQAFKTLGVRFSDTKGKILPITEIAELLHKRFGKLSEVDRIKLFNKGFGDDASRAASALARLGPGLQDYIKATKDKNAAEQLAKTNTEGAAGAIERLKGAIETIKIQIGTAFLPAVASVATFIADRLIPAVEEFWKVHGPGITAAFQKAGELINTVFVPAFAAVKQAFEESKPEIMFFVQYLLGPMLAAIATVAGVGGLLLISVAIQAVMVWIKVLTRGIQGLVVIFTTAIQTMLESAASAADAIGMTDLADKLRKAADSVRKFRDDVNEAVEGVITYKEIIVKGAAVFMNGAPSQIHGMKRGINDFEPSKAKRRAGGGMIRGAGTATSDSIPAWLSNGEFVMNAKATRAIGPSNLYAMQAAAAQYATGGLAALGGGWPRFAGGGILHPRVQSDTTQFAAGINAFDKQVTNRAIQMAKQMATTLGGLDGPGSWKWQMSVLRQMFPGLALISGFRPGAITATGRRSYHASGRAVDIPPRMDVFNWIRANYGAKTKELIFSPAGGRQIHNGQPHVYTGVTKAMHYDHVHWAFRNGGLVPTLAGGGAARPMAAGVPLTLGSPGRGWKFQQARMLYAHLAGQLGQGRTADADLTFAGQPGRYNNDALADVFYRQHRGFKYYNKDHGTRMTVVNWLRGILGMPVGKPGRYGRPKGAPTPRVPGRIGGNAFRASHILSRMNETRRAGYAQRYGLPKAPMGWYWGRNQSLKHINRIGGNAFRVNHFLSRMPGGRRAQYAKMYGLPKPASGWAWAEDATLVKKGAQKGGTRHARHAEGGLVRARSYDSGGWLQPGATLAINNTGRPERITPAGGGTQVIVLKVDGRELARVVNDQNVRSGRLA